MFEGIFEINSYEIDDLLEQTGKTSSDISNTNDEAKSTLEPYKQSEVFGEGAKTINEQLDQVFDELLDFRNSFQKGTSAVFETEMKILEEARNLQIPTGFSLNGTSIKEQAKDVTLSKNDGRSVNDGESTTNEEKMDDYTETEHNELRNDYNENGLEINEKIDISGKMTDLNSINNNSNLEEQELIQGNNKYNQKMISNINVGTSGQIVENDFNANTNNVELRQISTDSIPLVSIDNDININVNNVELQQINTGSVPLVSPDNDNNIN